MAYNSNSSAARVSFEWDDEDVELFEDPSPAPARGRANPSTSATPARKPERTKEAVTVKPSAPRRPSKRRTHRDDRAAETKTRRGALPGARREDRISVPENGNSAATYLLAIFTPRFITTSVTLILAGFFVRGVVG
jgi:hypothetical protein